MSFLTFSLFLGGLAAASIPVLLHLLMRGTPKRIEFPALRLIQVRLQVTKRNLRLKQLLLLALRILVLILMGLLLARPSLKLADWFPSLAGGTGINEDGSIISTLASSLGTQEAPVAAALVFDTSPRMEYTLANQTRLDAAKVFATWVLGQIPSGSDIAVLSGHRETAAFQVDPYAAAQRIERLNVEAAGRPLVETVLEALRLLDQSEIEERELYIFTDMTAPGWTGDQVRLLRDYLEVAAADPVRKPGIFLVDIGAEPVNDSGIAALTLSEQVPGEMTPVHLAVDLVHFGDAEERTVELWMQAETEERRPGVEKPGDFAAESPDSEDGPALRRGSRQIRFDTGSSVQHVAFEIPGLPPGTHQGEIRLSGTDPLSANDRFFFSLHTHKAWKTLIAAPAPTAVHASYLQVLLDPHPQRLGGGGAFQTETLAYEELERLSMRDLTANYQTVFLLDPPPLKPATWKALADYVSQGGGLGTFPGKMATRLETFHEPTVRELLGGTLIRQARVPEDEDLWIAPDDYLLPIFATFRPMTVAETPWSEVPVRRYWEMQDISERAMIAARFSDGRPAILMQTLGRGRTLTMTTPISDPPHQVGAWNYLTETNWIFYALIDGIARYLVGAGEQDFNFVAGRPAVIRLGIETEPFPENCLLAVPGQKTAIRLDTEPAERTIRYPMTEQVGNYRLRSGGSRELLDTGFSVNYPSGEWDLQPVSTTLLDETLGPKNYRVVKTPAEIEISIARRRVGQELYAPILFLLCLVFLGEYLFANFFYGNPSAKS